MATKGDTIQSRDSELSQTIRFSLVSYLEIVSLGGPFIWPCNKSKQKAKSITTKNSFVEGILNPIDWEG